MSQPTIHTTAAGSTMLRSPLPAAEWQVPALYDRLGQALRLADAAIAAGDLSVRSAQLERASSVVFELLASVDFQQGGELAPRLAALYGFFASELLAVGRSGERAQLARLVDMVEVLNGSWRNDDALMGEQRQPVLVD